MDFSSCSLDNGMHVPKSLGCFGKSHSPLGRHSSKCSALSCIRGRAGFPMSSPNSYEIEYLEIPFVRIAPDSLCVSTVRNWTGLSLNESPFLTHMHKHAAKLETHY